MDGWDIKTIVLGYDGSASADKALGLASTLASQNNARILVVSTYELKSSEADGYRLGAIAQKAQEVAQDAVSKLEAAGIAAEPEVVDGRAEDVLLEVSESRGADLIVVGRRGLGAFTGLLLGSTSEYVVRRAKVPVLVAH